MKKVIYSATLVASLFVLGACGNDAVEKVVPTPTEETENTENNVTTEENDAAVEEDDVPREYKSALTKAKTYSDMMHMSKLGIYDQLVSEHGDAFPPEAAQYAVDNLTTDYNANALKKAENYAETMSMSNAAIYDQLVSEHGERFTPEEAQYAVDNLSN